MAAIKDEDWINDNNPTVADFLCHIVQQAKGLMADADIPGQPGESYDPSRQNWDAVQFAMTNLLMRAGCLHDSDGNVLNDEFSIDTDQVHGIAEEFDAMLESQLVMAVLDDRDKDGLFTSELVDLAGVMYHRRDADAQARVRKAVSFLLKQGVLTRANDDFGRVYIVRVQPDRLKLHCEENDEPESSSAAQVSQ
jgi:hypothetical protein